MKSNLSKILVVVSILLAVGLAAMKWSDNAQLDTATVSINDYSNRLDMAQTQIAMREGNLLILSNNLAETSLTFSNQLSEAQSIIVLQSEQLTNLSQQVATTTAKNETLSRNVMDLTNRLAALASRNAQTEASLAQAHTNLVESGNQFAQLEDRFRRNVAERLVVERKFNNLSELQAQLQQLKQHPAQEITAQSIYAGLDVVVNGDGKCYVISPD
jgi:chromosome segregation ATPase